MVRECFDRDSIIEKNCGGQKEHTIICVLTITQMNCAYAAFWMHCKPFRRSECKSESFLCVSPHKLWSGIILLVQLNVTRVTRKSQVSRSAAPKSERPGVFEWVLEEVKYVAAEGNDRTYIEKDKKKRRKKTAARKVSQAWSTEVCHTGWSGQEIIICAALEECEPEEKSIKRDWAEGTRVFMLKLRV